MEHSDTDDAESVPLKMPESPVPDQGQGPVRSMFRAGVYNDRGYRRVGNKFTRFILFLVVATLLWISQFYLAPWNSSSFPTTTQDFERIGMKSLKNVSNHGKSACLLPQLDPFGAEMMQLMNRRNFGKDFDCSRIAATGIYKRAAFHVEKGNILVRDLEFPGDVNCSFKDGTAIKHWYDDGKPLKIDLDANSKRNRTVIQFPTEVLLVKCRNSQGILYYKDAFQIVQKKPEVEERIRKWEEGQLQSKLTERLSVLIIGMDTTSQMHFERALPRSKRYLDETLNAVRIMGYNKVGDNTIMNWIPLFTGMSFDEFPRSCVEQPNNRVAPAEDCPFIWNTFASQGYRTSFAEDNMLLPAFYLAYNNTFAAKVPTDYYWIPFYDAMVGVLGFSGQCYGPRMSIECLTDVVKSMADVFNDNSTKNLKRHRPYFSFVWSGKLGHGNLNEHAFADKPLLEVLQYLHGNGHLNHTAVFLLGDHGWRNRDDIKQSMIENRMPLAYIVLPPWFRQRYSRPFQNLRLNAENTTTSTYDMHKTILDILDLERFDGPELRANRHFRSINPKMSRRGQSLFEISAKKRNCESAGIPWMWCLCVDKIPLSSDSFLAVNAAQAAIDTVNREMEAENYSAVCETLRVGHVISAALLNFNDLSTPECRLLVENVDVNASVPAIEKFSHSGCKHEILVEIKIVGIPRDPVYTTVAVFHPAAGNFSAPHEITREDWYSTKGHCVFNSFRPYCICKVSNFDATGIYYAIPAFFILFVVCIFFGLVCCFRER